RTIVESARTMIHSKRMDKKFWAEAVNSAVHVLNRTGTSTVPNKTPYELWYNKRAKMDHLRIFGSEVFV
ncbi:Copia protein, partial [Camponotus floridanus]